MCVRYIKKSNRHSGKLTQVYFMEICKAEKKILHEEQHRLNVSRVLTILGVSRNGYYVFKKRKPSDKQIIKEQRMDRVGGSN